MTAAAARPVRLTLCLCDLLLSIGAQLPLVCCRRNCKFYSLIRPFDKDDLRMLAKVAGFFSNQTQQRMAPFELTAGQWQAFGNWFMSYLRLFRCHQQLWMARSPTAICGFGVDRARAETLLAQQPSVSASCRQSRCKSFQGSQVSTTSRQHAFAKASLYFPAQKALAQYFVKTGLAVPNGVCWRLLLLRLGSC